MSVDWDPGRAPEDAIRKIRGPLLFAWPVRRFLEGGALVIQGHAREGAPVDTGRLRGSIGYQIDRRTIPTYAKVGTNVAYARYMEYGTGALSDKPETVAGWKFPTGAELDTWARRHGFAQGSHVADIIRWKGGLAPRRYLRNAFEKSKSDIQKLLRNMAAEIEKAWAQ